MVEIVNGLGMNVLCKKCNSPIVLSSSDNYKGCVNCGFENDLTPKFHWYDNFYLWIFFAAYIIFIIKIMFYAV